MSTSNSNRIDSTFALKAKRGRRWSRSSPPATSLDAALPTMHALARRCGCDRTGCAILDLDGRRPGDQRSSNARWPGMSLRKVLAIVTEFRKTNSRTPVVLMGYANPVEAIGQAKFVDTAAAGVDGVLWWTIYQKPTTSRRCCKAGLAPIFLLAPTSTPERIAHVARLARGYVYYVSLRGVTGAGHRR